MWHSRRGLRRGHRLHRRQGLCGGRGLRGRRGSCGRHGLRGGRGPTLYQPINLCLLLLAVVNRAARRRAGTTVGVSGGVRFKRGRELLFAVEQSAQRKEDTCVLRRGSGYPQRFAELRNEPIIGGGRRLQVRVARKRFEAASIERQNPLIQRASLFAPSQILVQVGKIQQCRYVVGILLQCPRKLLFGRGILAQQIGVNDTAIEVNFLRRGDTVVQGSLVRLERFREPALSPQQDREIEPALRQVRPFGERTLVGFNVLRHAPEAVQLLRFSNYSLFSQGPFQQGMDSPFR